MAFIVLRALVPVVLACAPAGRPIVTEVLYDLTGDDTGREYVELWNPLPMDWPLAGVRLEAGDGSAPSRWSTRWTGAAGDTLKAGRRWVVGGALVVPTPDAVVTLDLQNGPDAVRLVWPDGAAEVVGFGPHDFPEYACGAAAADVPSGLALARTPDDADFGSNAADFGAALPTPGRANVAARNLAPSMRAPSTWTPRAGERFDARAVVANRGRTSLGAGEARLHASVPGDSASEMLPELAAGDSIPVTLSLVAPFGAFTARVRVTWSRDDEPADDADELRMRSGPPALSVREVQFHPADGEGEWVELANESGAPLELAGWSLSDRTTTRGNLPSLSLPPGALVVVAQDAVALRARFPSIDTARVLRAAPWPSLNNTDGDDGLADRIVVRDAEGLSVEDIGFSARGVPQGSTLERAGFGFVAGPPGGTPLAAPVPLDASAPAAFVLATARSAPSAVEASWTLPWPRAKVWVELWDLEGRRGPRLLDGVLSGSRGVRALDLSRTRPGLWLAAFHAREDGGSREVRLTRPLRIDGSIR